YVPGPEHADDEIVAEDQPYVEDASPTAQLPEYVLESDLEAHPEDDDDEDPKEDPVDYPVDGGDDGDDEEGSSEDDDMDIEADKEEEEEEHPAPADSADEEEEEEEHPAPADSVVVTSTAADQAPSAEETESFETDESAATPPPHPAYRMTARISIPAPVPMPACRKEDRPEVTLPPRKKLGIALGPGYEVGESSSATAAARPTGGLRVDYGFVATMDREIIRDPEREVGYGITDSWDEIVETLQGAPVSTDTKLGGYMREFETRVRQDTEEIYMRLDDEQSERQLLAGRLNMLFRDRRAHAYTRHPMETEARMSREAWVQSTDASDLVRVEVMSLRTTVLGQMTEIRKLHAADRRRQTVISEMLRADHRRSTETMDENKRDPEREVGYGITDSWDEIVETLQGAPVSTNTELDGYMREFETRVRQDTDEIYMRLDDEQTERQLLAGRLNMLFRDRRAHAYTRHLMETEARMSREAWVRSTDASDLVHGEVMSLRTTVLGQMTEIRELHVADRRRQIVILELLRADHRRST
nr:hypothetical protein [Tanacetum cinerariifolium]